MLATSRLSTTGAQGAPHSAQFFSAVAAWMILRGSDDGKVAKWASENGSGGSVQTERGLRPPWSAPLSGPFAVSASPKYFGARASS